MKDGYCNCTDNRIFNKLNLKCNLPLQFNVSNYTQYNGDLLIIINFNKKMNFKLIYDFNLSILVFFDKIERNKDY